MVGKEELVELRNVLDMVEKEEDKPKDVTIDCKLDCQLMDQEEPIGLVRFASVPYDQKHSVMNIVLVEQIHRYPQRVDRLDRATNGKLDRYLNRHPYRKHLVGMNQVNQEKHH